VTTTRDDVRWLVGEFVANVRGVVCAVAISGDGLALGYSQNVHRDTADGLAAAGGGARSLAIQIAGLLRAGRVHSSMIEVDAGFIFQMATDTGESVLVLGGDDCDPAEVTYQLTLVIEKFGQMLAVSAAPRQAGVSG